MTAPQPSEIAAIGAFSTPCVRRAIGLLMVTTTSFDVDERTVELITSLQKTFGVKTKAAVIRKALALAHIASQNAITLADSEIGKHAVKVFLSD